MSEDTNAPEENDKPKGKRPAHPLVGADEGYPFAETPEDYAFGKQQLLKKKDFQEDWQFMIYRAQESEHKAAELREKAEKVKSLGSAKDRAAARRLQRMQEQMAALKEKLANDGVDVEALLASA